MGVTDIRAKIAQRRQAAADGWSDFAERAQSIPAASISDEDTRTLLNRVRMALQDEKALVSAVSASSPSRGDELLPPTSIPLVADPSRRTV